MRYFYYAVKKTEGNEFFYINRRRCHLYCSQEQLLLTSTVCSEINKATYNYNIVQAEEGAGLQPLLVIGIIGALILLVLIVGTPLKPLRFVGQTAIKIMIGALFLFFLNAFGNSMGIHVPINLATSAISGVLGIPGVAALVIIQMYII